MIQQSLEKDISRGIVIYLDALRAQGRLTFYVNIEGGKRDVRQQVSLKRQGVRPGRPDIEIFPKRKPGAAQSVIFVELKRKKGGRLSDHQRNEIEQLTSLGYECHVIKAIDQSDAISQIETILEFNSI